MNARLVSMMFGVAMMLSGAILIAPETGPVVEGAMGFVFAAAGLIQLVASLVAPRQLTCPHCHKKNDVRVGLWSATPRLSPGE